MKKRKRIVNVRFLFCVFIGLMIGIIVSRLFLFRETKMIWAILTGVIVVGVSIGAYIYGKKTEKDNLAYKSTRKVSRLIKWSSVGFCVAFLIGIIISTLPIISLFMIHNYDGEVTITGIACNYVDTEDTYQKFILKDCELIVSGHKESLDTKIIVYTDTYSSINLGDRVSFVGEVEALSPDEDYDLNLLINDIGYSTYVSSSNLIIGENYASLKDWMHNKSFSLLNTYLNRENAFICYAVLFGQKEGLDESLTDMFSYAGISHILAVSGLHVGVLVSIIWFIVKKIKVKPFIKLSLFAFILLFYTYLCSFSPSVCRASLMAFFLAMCKTFKWEYDALSSVSLAGIIILLINPLMLFSISFQLSFMCIFAIITFSPCFKFALTKIKCPNWLAGNLSISFALNIAILPICMNTFGEVSLLGIISNLVILPLFSVVYILLFTAVLLGVIIKPLGILLNIPNLFLHLIKVIAQFVSSIPFGVFKIFNISYWMIALIALTTLTIHFLMTSHWLKSVGVLAMATFIAILFLLNTIPTRYEGDNVIVAKQYDSNVILVVSDGDVSLIGSDISYKRIMSIMKEIRLKNIDNIYAYDLQLNGISELKKILSEYNVNRIFLPSRYDYDELKNEFKNVSILNESQDVGNLELQLIEFGDEIIAIKINMGDKNILVPQLNNNKTESNYIINNYLDVEYILIDKDNKYWQDIDYAGLTHYWTDKNVIIKG